jgi:phage I-like protein
MIAEMRQWVMSLRRRNDSLQDQIAQLSADQTDLWEYNLRTEHHAMAAFEDLQAQVAALTATDSALIAAIDDLLTKAQAQGQVSEAEVQAVADLVKDEVSKLSAETEKIAASHQAATPEPAPPEATQLPAEPEPPVAQ